MCGITGAVWSEPRLQLDAPILERMMEVLRHRGPDDHGQYQAEYRVREPYAAMPGVALGFRRLSIIDLASGNQPIANEDGTVWVVFNGEIYNYQALRHRLEGAGHRFATQGDAETIVHLYEDEGLDAFAHLNGMFAIAVWDEPNRRLVLARDRLGQKPLVYRHEPGRLAFASELKSLLQIPGVSRSIDVAALDAYLTYQYVPHPRTIFNEIRKLPPGHLLTYCDDQVTCQPYWNPDFRSTFHGTQAEGVEQLRDLLADSVKLRLQSDVPLGAFLSGGVDSSLIVALMQQHATDPVKTFSIGFPVKEYDESKYARQVAEHLGTEHHEFEVTPDAVDILPQLVWHFDEPFADSSAIPTWYVSQKTREHVTVCLSGDGGDELFAGYPRYKAVALAQRIDRLGFRGLFGHPWWQKLPAPGRQKSRRRQWKRFCEALGNSPLRRYVDWISIYNETRRAALYADSFLESLPEEDPVSFIDTSWRRFNHRDPLTVVTLGDLVTYLPCDLMTKVDIASMAHSLECRQPFLDYRVVEFCASLPIAWKYRFGRGKRFLRQAFGNQLPAEIFDRKKMGFGVPLDHWFRHELRGMAHDVLLGPARQTADWFDQKTIESMLSEHEQNAFDHSYRLWSLLVLELWMQEWCQPKT